MRKYHLQAVTMVVLLFLAVGLVFAQDDPAPAACTNGEAAPCTEPYVMAADEGEAIWFGGGLATIKASSAQTDGAVAIIELMGVPGGGPLRIHHRETEAYYILEGTMKVVSGDQEWTASAGDFVWLPRELEHGYAVLAGENLRMLVIALPAGLDSFMREAGEPAQERTLPPSPDFDMDKLMAATTKYGIDILGSVEP